MKTLKSATLLMTAVSSCILVGILFQDFFSRSTSLKRILQPRKDLVHSMSRHIRSEKRQQHFKYYDSCVVAKPSKIDIEKLCKHQECSTIWCVQSCTCLSGCQIFSCFSPACAYFSYIYRGNHAKHDEKNNVTIEDLTRSIHHFVKDRSAESDINNKIKVLCSDPSSHLFHHRFEVDVFKDKSTECKNSQVTEEPVSEEGAEKSANSGLNVHILYFRFLSRWESIFKLPRLNSFIASKRSDPNWQVNTFDQMQSKSLVLEENLKSLLRRPVVSKTNQTETDLIKLAMEKGRCVIFDAIACHKSKIYEDIMEMTSSASPKTSCKSYQNVFTSLKTNNRTFCSRQTDNDMDMEDALYIHDRLHKVHQTSTGQQFSLSITNIPDLPSTYTFDTAITNVISNILRHQSNVLIIMSDVGDPKFARLDESVFLRTQTFNPLLHIFSPSHAKISHKLLHPELEINDSNFRLMDISDVFDLTKTLISLGDGPGEESSNMEELPINNSSQEYEREEEMSNRSCPTEKIKGPAECFCQGKAVYYVSDSVQAAFASFVVGSLNNELLDMGKNNHGQYENWTYKSHMRDTGYLFEHSKCDRLVGVSFNNVQHVLWQNSTFILMTLNVRPTFSRFSEQIKIKAEVEYVTDESNNLNITASILSPQKIKIGGPVALKSSFDKKMLHMLCQEQNDLNESRATRRNFVDSLSTGSLFGMKGKVKHIHFPCLYTITTTFPDSAMIEAANVCTDRTYNLSISLELFNVISLSGMFMEVNLQPGDIRYMTSLVKASYGVSSFAYKTKTTYTVQEFVRVRPMA